MKISNFSWNGQAVWIYEAIVYIAVAYSRVHTAGCKFTYHRWQVLQGGAPVVSGGENE